MEGTLARLSNAILSPPTTSPSSSLPQQLAQLGGGDGDDEDDAAASPSLTTRGQPAALPPAKAREKRERINLLQLETGVFWLKQIRSFQAGQPDAAGKRTGEQVCTQMKQYVPVCTNMYHYVTVP